jgi:lipoprotein NlpD
MPLSFLGSSTLRGLIVLACVAALGACSSNVRRAPVEDRNARAAMPAAGAASAPDTAASAPLPGAENAGKPGYYTVRPGDTMIRIGLETGQNWRDVQRWNNLENPNLLEVGQVLRVQPPAAVDPAATGPRPVTIAKVEPRPLDAKPPVAASAPQTPAPAAAAAPAATPRDDDEPQWTWPAGGAVLAGYDEARSKGVAIGGKLGDPVLAAADGRVVYAGSGLRGYGNLVIVKHNATYLTAYAHNQALLVKEDQSVRRGQKIAEMGSTDAERVQLHFEIRKLGKPVDPTRLLPPR